MSPDQNNPQSSPDHIKDLINQDLHPEGVRPFTAPLDEVADHLVVPDKIDAIDPITGNVDFTRLDSSTIDTPTQPFTESSDAEPTPSRWNKKNKIRAAIAGVVGTVVLGGGGYVALHDETRSNEPTSVSPEKTAPEIDVIASTPEQLVGTIVDNNLERLNARPNQDILDSLDVPILTSDYSLEDAAVKAGQKISAYYLSGESTFDTSNGGKLVVLTPESTEEGNVILSDIFSSDVDISSSSYDWMRGTRASIAFRLGFYGTDKQYSKVTGEPQYATDSLDWVVAGSASVSPEAGTVAMELHQYTNFEELDPADLFDHPEIDTNQTFNLNMTMIAENGEWRVQSLAPAS